MKNFNLKNTIAKLFLTLTLVTGLSVFAFAANNSNTNAAVESIVDYFTVEAFQVSTHTVKFYAGEKIYIKATGDGSTDLDMVVKDARGALIVQDYRETTDGYVYFTARRTGNYSVRVINNEDDFNEYELRVDIY